MDSPSLKQGLFRGTRPVILSTIPDQPSRGRTFVWAWTQWFERIEGSRGNVAFTPVASNEQELNRWLAGQGVSRPEEIRDEYADMVCREFLAQVPLYPANPETSSEKPFREQDPDADVEHQ
jgi:hypothetical protein